MVSRCGLFVALWIVELSLTLPNLMLVSVAFPYGIT